MSIKVITWVREHAPTENPAELCILYSLADRANDDGEGCWPSVATLAQESRCSQRTVQRHLRNLEDRGLIRKGDQRMVEKYRADRRPVVWDLNLAARRSDAGCQSDTSLQSRGDNSGANGVTNQASRGDTVVTQTINKPIIKPEGVEEAVTTGLEGAQEPTPKSLDDLAQAHAGGDATASPDICPQHPYGNSQNVPCAGCRDARMNRERAERQREQSRKGEVVRELRKRNETFVPPPGLSIDKYPAGVAEVRCSRCGSEAGVECVRAGKRAVIPCAERLAASKRTPKVD